MARVLRRVIVTVTVALVCASTFSAILGHGETAILIALGAPLGVSAWGFARAGQNEAAVVLLALVLVTVVTLILVMSPLGFHDLAIVGYAGTLAIVALLVSRRIFLALTVVALAAGTVVFVLEQIGRTRSELAWITGWTALLDFLLVTAVSAGLARLVAETLLESLGAAESAATIDPVTGLPNRAHFVMRARAILRPATGAPPGAVLVIADLDDFRRINMVVGHAAADRLLAEAAARLAALDGAGMLAGRIGDDEFAMLMPGDAGPDAARYLGQRVASSLDFQAAGVPIHATVGVARFPDDAPTIESLLQAADASLRAAKQQRPSGSARLIDRY